MPIGVTLQLSNGSTPQANLTGIQALWWDAAEPKDFTRPVGKSTAVTTDASGYISLDLSSVTGLAPGDYGFLMLYKKDVTDSNESLVFSGKAQTSTVTSGVDMYYYDSGWTRPADWLELPDVTGLQMFAGLHRVYPDSNFCALSAAGNYTVDWGDGTVENIASGVVAYHQYDYTTFDVAEATLCSRGYKQAVVTVVPQAGQSLTAIDLTTRHNQPGLQAYTSGFVDIAVAGALLASLRIGQDDPYWGEQRVRFMELEQVQLIGANSITNFSFMFRTCRSLQSTPLLNTAAGTNFSYMFTNCSSLESISLLNTALGTNFNSMFSNCSSLKSIPVLNTAAGVNFSSMLAACTSLQSVPLLNTASGIDFSFMFNGCFLLQSVPLLNTTSGITFNNMFATCSSLHSVPLLDTTSGTNFANMFQNCNSLQSSLMFGTKNSISYTSCKLSPSALNSIYNSLYGPVSAKTITVTNNWGTTSDNPTLATAKGWTVTG